MRETVRCCISCILPCGALDVIRIVHANGRVEEISHGVCAGEIMRAYPKHVLRKPPSPASVDDVDDRATDSASPRQAVVLQPTAELQRGKIYFLMPVSYSSSDKAAASKPKRRGRRREEGERNGPAGAADRTTLIVSSDRYLSEILTERVSTPRDGRRGRVGVWRPHLESISELATDI